MPMNSGDSFAYPKAARKGRLFLLAEIGRFLHIKIRQKNISLDKIQSTFTNSPILTGKGTRHSIIGESLISPLQ